jgi:hypothetical protein
MIICIIIIAVAADVVSAVGYGITGVIAGVVAADLLADN